MDGVDEGGREWAGDGEVEAGGGVGVMGGRQMRCLSDIKNLVL